jgi:hypothetical protein
LVAETDVHGDWKKNESRGVRHLLRQVSPDAVRDEVVDLRCARDVTEHPAERTLCGFWPTASATQVREDGSAPKATESPDDRQKRQIRRFAAPASGAASLVAFQHIRCDTRQLDIVTTLLLPLSS